MYYWQYPDYIDWDNIDSYYSVQAIGDCASPIAQLMDELIDKCDVHMTCDYGLTTPENLVDGLKYFGFSNAENVDYSFAIVRQNVEWGYPVIIKGADGLFNQHYWICDRNNFV